MSDDGIRERHGMTVRRPSPLDSICGVFLVEREDHVELMKMDDGRVLTVPQARYLARKLYHLARRIDKRAEGSA